MSQTEFCRLLRGSGYCSEGCQGGLNDADYPPGGAASIRHDLAHQDQLDARYRIQQTRAASEQHEPAMRMRGAPVCKKTLN